MSLAPPIRSVLVCGGGIVAWSAAAALKRRLPLLDISILPMPVPADALADRLSGTLPSVTGFHEDLGLTEADTVARAGSSKRFGTVFAGWSKAPPTYTHRYTPVGEPIGAGPFHQQWLRLAAKGLAEPFDRYGAAPTGAASEAAYGLHLDPSVYLQMLQAFAAHLGVRRVLGAFAGVRLREGGFVDAVRLDEGRERRADLFVDATGPAARVRNAIDDQVESWREWLIADTLFLRQDAPAGAAQAYDRNEAFAAGWSWQAASARSGSAGLVTVGDMLSDTDRERQGFAAAERISVSPLRRRQSWRANCVAIGDAAVRVEPLEWTNLHLAHNAIDRIVAMMPGIDCAPVELAEYNRQTEDEVLRIRDFLCLHYVAGPQWRGAFWQAAASVPLPPSLEHTLTLFRECGRLPFYEEETFDRDSWLTVLLCQGERPRRIDPLTELMPLKEAQAALAALSARRSPASYAARPSHESLGA